MQLGLSRPCQNNSLVRGWKYFPPGSKVLIFFNTQLCQSARGVKGESSPSTAWLYLPINVTPFPHLISLCDHPSYRTGSVPVPLYGYIRVIGRCEPSSWDGHRAWGQGQRCRSQLLARVPISHRKLCRDDWLIWRCSTVFSENERSAFTTYTYNPSVSHDFFCYSCFFCKPIPPFTSGIQIQLWKSIKWNSWSQPSPPPQGPNPYHHIWIKYKLVQLTVYLGAT